MARYEAAKYKFMEYAQMNNFELAVTAVQVYAELHPRPSHVNQKQAAFMLDKSVTTVKKMINSGVLKLNKCGMIPIHDIDRALVA